MENCLHPEQHTSARYNAELEARATVLTMGESWSGNAGRAGSAGQRR